MRILLTGSRGGIGTSIQEILVAEGHTVLAPTSKELDLSKHEVVTDWIKLNSYQEIDAVIFCAGTNTPRDFLEVEYAEYSRTLEININSNREILKALLPGMLNRKFGRIVAISSAYATIARDGRSSYSISKAALEALIRSIALENAQSNIIANSIVPGFIETPLTLKNNTQLQIDKILERIPMQRFGSPLEVANLVSFLISDKNTYITGQSFRIDGGFSIN
jgi:NAD(P)-dependent dehydrogenase (short-subunit alcohol dehydrogenase family)